MKLLITLPPNPRKIIKEFGLSTWPKGKDEALFRLRCASFKSGGGGLSTLANIMSMLFGVGNQRVDGRNYCRRLRYSRF